MSLSPRSLRLCHITKWPHFDGYGFNLHAEKGKNGQYIGKVDENSPAEAAGLKEGDRIIEVNGVNVSNENHKQVVARIKAVADSTELLVVDPAGDTYFKTNDLPIHSGLPCVVRNQTPVDCIENSETDSEKPSHATPSINNEIHDLSNDKQEEKVIAPKLPEQNLSENEKTTKNNSLNLNMTARELRAQLAARKKYDPKKDNSLDAKKKYDIVQKL